MVAMVKWYHSRLWLCYHGFDPRWPPHENPSNHRGIFVELYRGFNSIDKILIAIMNRVVMLHGRWPEKIDGKLIADIPLCNPNNEGNWMGWTKKKLEEAGYRVTCPIIVDAWQAPYSEWKKVIDTLEIDEQTIVVGLSAGGAVWVRWLSETGRKVKKLILIAPGSKYTATDDDPLPSKKEFYDFEIPSTIKSQIIKGTTIFVSNDSQEILKSVELYKDILDAKVMKLENLSHFSFLIPQLPELLDEILK